MVQQTASLNATPAFTHDTFALIFIVGGFVDKGLLSSGDVGSVTITSRLPFIYEQLLAFEQIDFVVPKHFFDHAKFEVFNPLVEHVFVYKAFSLPLVERVADVRAPPIHRVTARATHVTRHFSYRRAHTRSREASWNFNCKLRLTVAKID